MNSVIIYGRNGCPKCFYIQKKMEQKENVNLEIVHDDEKTIKVIEENGFSDELPIVVINGHAMQFNEAKKWIEEN